jgi:hypothetical protein
MHKIEFQRGVDAAGSAVREEAIHIRRRWLKCLGTLACGAFLLSGCSTPSGLPSDQRASRSSAETIKALNALRNDLNAQYGFRNGAPRINLGPCGRFARDFRERWNALFREPVNIAFVMATNDPSNCFHVLLRLPDGRYFDGGNGVVTEAFLKALYPEGRVEEMKKFDFELLNKRSYGLGRTYPECPNYSDAFTRAAIAQRLSELRASAP